MRQSAILASVFVLWNASFLSADECLPPESTLKTENITQIENVVPKSCVLDNKTALDFAAKEGFENLSKCPKSEHFTVFSATQPPTGVVVALQGYEKDVGTKSVAFLKKLSQIMQNRVPGVKLNVMVIMNREYGTKEDLQCRKDFAAELEKAPYSSNINLVTLDARSTPNYVQDIMELGVS